MTFTDSQFSLQNPLQPSNFLGIRWNSIGSGGAADLLKIISLPLLFTEASTTPNSLFVAAGPQLETTKGL